MADGKKDRDRRCPIRIEKSLVVIICDEVEIDKLKDLKKLSDNGLDAQE